MVLDDDFTKYINNGNNFKILESGAESWYFKISGQRKRKKI